MKWVNVSTTVLECVTVTLSFNVSIDCSVLTLSALAQLRKQSLNHGHKTSLMISTLSLAGQGFRNFNGKLDFSLHYLL